MSIEAVSAVLNAPLGGTRKIVLIGLANHADPDLANAYPAINRIATYAHCSERTVQRCLRWLEYEGWIEKTGEHRLSSRADRVVNIYRIRGDKMSPRQTNGVTSGAERGDTAMSPRESNGVTSGAERGDTAMSPEPSYKPSHKNNHRERARARGFPDDFELTEERVGYARSKGVDPELEFEKFRDYHLAKGSLFRDWDAAWRNWCRRAREFGHRGAPSSPCPDLDLGQHWPDEAQRAPPGFWEEYNRKCAEEARESEA